MTQKTDVAIGVDVTNEGTHVVAMRMRPDGRNVVIYSQFHPLVQPKPEPMAWRNAAIRVGEDLCSVGPFGYYDMTAEQWLDWALSVVTVHAPPPQRKPLTDEAIATVYWGATGQSLRPQDNALAHNFARAIEAAHGIK
jgi:hypothetical protein